MVRFVLALAVLAGCTSVDGSPGAGGAEPGGVRDPTVTVVGEPCCPDPSMLGYSTDVPCFADGLTCPWIWLDTGAQGGGVVRCAEDRWSPWEECPDGDLPADCPGEGADLGACDVGTSGGCVCVCRSARGVCEQSAACIDGRWIALASALDETAWCPPCSPVTVTAWADGSCTAERTCVRDEQLVDCTPTEDGATCDCSVAGELLGSCVDGSRGDAVCSFDEGCCADVLGGR